ncbi:non-ribosomal peptide synthetase, partial [Niastella populi]|uniref:non-ribosomal peptide synthetase n=1 Tax=Niastella populi TaxID=550983 RepID=UPI00105485D0
ELSPLQEGIYYHWLAETSNSLYFEQISYRVRANVLNVEKLKGAYDRLTARHAVLRTSFSTEYAGRSLQIVRKEVPGNFTYEKLDSGAGREEKVELIRQQDRERGFDLSRGSQVRLHVIDLSAGEYEFIWSHHHILMDGWCGSVLINDFNELLSAAMKGSTADLPPVTPYSNYINWLRTIDREHSLSYWKDYLEGYSTLAEIPFKAAGGADSSYVESREHLQIGGDLFKKVDALCSELGITHNTFVQGVWGYLLSRYNNTNDVVFGEVVSGRPADLPGVEDMVGLFINTIPVRVKYDQDDTPVELLKSLQKQSIESTSHHYMNLSEVQSQSELGMALMTHIMIFENYAVKELENEGALNSKGEEGLAIESREVFERTNYDFNVIVIPSAVSLGIIIKYNLNSYDQLSLKNLIRHFDKLISDFAHNSDQSLQTFDYLTEEEKHTLLVTFNDTVVAYPKDKSIVDLFEEQAAKTPDNIAVVFGEKELTYQELNERSNQFAHYLREQGIREETLVPICMERGLEMLIGILGILKAGGAYVPIDPAYPRDRISYVLADTAAQLVVATSESEPALPRDYTGLMVVVDRDWAVISKQPSTPLTTTLCPTNLAYVIYTSGSTGMPKGVLIQHSNVVRLFFNDAPLFDFNEKDTWTLFHSFSFDFSVWEMYGALFYGGRLVIVPKWITRDVNAFRDLLVEQQVTVLNQTPSAFYVLQGCVAGKVMQLCLRYVIFGGEALNPAKIKPWKEQFPSCRLVNMYGITETTVHVTYQEIGFEHLDNSSSIIGKAIPTLTIFILDSAQQLVTVGVAGEICIGGAGLAQGYLNQPALTAEKFIAHPFEEGERLYRSGDLGRWLPDGNIEFIGRKDEQVKIRGHRIELGEIEHALVNHGEIDQAVIITKQNGSGEKELVAYITSDVEQNTNDLRAYLKASLPEYMLPAYFVQLEELPLTSNGKIDKKSLPDPEGLGLSSGVEYVAPGNEIEEKLVKIWEEVLQRENIGVNDDFFALGGHSLKVVRLSNEYQKELAVKLTLKELFAHTSV